jgi:hypothetical protein
MFQPMERMPLNLDSSLMQTPKVKPKGGMFGGRKVGDLISNFILNYAAANGNPGAAATIAQMHQNKMFDRREQYEEQQYQRQRMDGRDDFLWKQDHTAPQPTELERLIQAAGIAPGSDEYASFAKKMLDVKTNPMVMTPYGPMPYSAVNPQQPVKPVGKITPIDGGPASQAPGGFLGL